MDYIKISFEDLQIAKEFFDNEKHYKEWLFMVMEYYQGNENIESSIKIVQKYFTTYKKTMNFVIKAKESGKKGGLQRIENEINKINTLQGSFKDTSRTLQANNNKKNNNNNNNNSNSNSNSNSNNNDKYQRVIDKFNEVNNTNYQLVESRIKQLKKLSLSHDLDNLDIFEGVFRFKHFEWSNDVKMAKYNNPDTILGKFDIYVEQAKNYKVVKSQKDIINSMSFEELSKL